MRQIAMVGDDWKSEKERASDKKAIAARAKAARHLARKLDDASTAIVDFLSACRACGDGSGDETRGIADGRTILLRDIREYSGWLEKVFPG